MKLALGILAAAATALSACADHSRTAGVTPGAPRPMAAASASQCFDYSEMRGHTFSPEDRAIYLNVEGRDVFKLDVGGSCLGGAISSDPLVIVRRGGERAVCWPIDLDISVRGAGGFGRRCFVEGIRRLTPEEVAALPPRVRP